MSLASPTDEWLTRWLKSPDKMLQTADAQATLKEYNNTPMPNQGLSDTEIAPYTAYFHRIDAQTLPIRTEAAH